MWYGPSPLPGCQPAYRAESPLPLAPGACAIGRSASFITAMWAPLNGQVFFPVWLGPHRCERIDRDLMRATTCSDSTQGIKLDLPSPLLSAPCQHLGAQVKAWCSVVRSREGELEDVAAGNSTAPSSWLWRVPLGSQRIVLIACRASLGVGRVHGDRNLLTDLT
jgi:hypothetical protein